MSLTHPPTLSFGDLRTPPAHGDVLVVPDPPAWVPALAANHQSLGESRTPLLGATIGDWRRRTREAIAGRDDQYLIVCGHQPAFIHPGVWAKHVLAARCAKAVGGLAFNLIVDSDAPQSTSLNIATEVEGHAVARTVRFADLPAGQPYEQIPRLSETEISAFEGSLRAALGGRYDDSQLSRFFRGMREAGGDVDWVDQAVAGRRAIEAAFGVNLDERRISRVCPGPLLHDMVLNAPRFVACYNAALAAYRLTYRIRGSQRPIPDLLVTEDRHELPVWLWRRGETRHRLFVAHMGDTVQLFAEELPIGQVATDSLQEGDGLSASLGGWCLRPRALTLTLWARILLADLFVHGIGGAKYDRISDRIMADYYGVTPPNMACVSATIWLDLPRPEMDRAAFATLAQGVRDFRFNPQRHLRERGDLVALFDRRRMAVERAALLRTQAPRDRAARRQAFDEIRHATSAILEVAEREYEAVRAEARAAARQLDEATIARNREYFFGLYSDRMLRQLMAALPQVADFRV